MQNQFHEFNRLHQQSEPLLLANAWDAQSARLFEQQNCKAIATSSAAVAESLGYNDGEEMPFDEYLFVIKRIASSVSIPFSVDMEGGYGNSPAIIVENITRLYELGVSGINIEDSIVTDGKRSIADPSVFAVKLQQVAHLLDTRNISMFINVRLDSFLLGLPNPTEDALSRAKLYQDTGVHGLFFPCVTELEDISQLTKYSKLPVNIMCMPGLAGFQQLKLAGVKRISAGPFLNKKVYRQLAESVNRIQLEQNFSTLF